MLDTRILLYQPLRSVGLLLRRRTQFLSSREAEQKSDFLARFSEWQPLAAERPEGPRADSPCKQSPAPASTWLFSFHDLLTSSKRIPAWPRQEILPGWNALETPIREREATGPAGERSQSHIPHGPPPDSLRPKASGSPVLTSRICTESSHTGHSGSPLGWGTAPRHSLAGQGEVAGFRDRSCGSGVDEQARLRGGSSPGQWSYPRPLSPPPCPLLPTRPSSPPHPPPSWSDPPGISAPTPSNHPESSVLALRRVHSDFICYSNYMISLNTMATDEPCMKTVSWDFPGRPRVETLPSSRGHEGSIPSQQAKLPHASLAKKQKT